MLKCDYFIAGCCSFVAGVFYYELCYICNCVTYEELCIVFFGHLDRQSRFLALAVGTNCPVLKCLPAGVVLPLKLESDVKSIEAKLLSPQFYTELVRTCMQ